MADLKFGKNSSLIRKFHIKILQKLCLITLSAPENEGEPTISVEETISTLLDALFDKETIVRWSAAKGLGRILSKIHEDSRAEIIELLVSAFHDSTSYEACYKWHGICLSFAEIGRRGIIPDTQLEKVLECVEMVLTFLF